MAVCRIMDENATAILGQGRSGVVLRCHDGQGRDIARKIFRCTGVTKLVHYIVFGAPNPYLWCEHAVRAAALRRQILSDLVDTWLTGKLRIAAAWEWHWNAQMGAYALDTEWIDGRHASLLQPFNEDRNDEAYDLYRNVMRPLQRHLVQAGFDGLLWQAGCGNPVALNNFLIDRKRPAGHWAWIDLESGVPALFPANPLQLLQFYLPKSWRHGGPLFDDVDIAKLRCYVETHKESLESHLGQDRVRTMVQRIEELAGCQNRWRMPRRVDRSIQFASRQGRLTPAEAKWYARHPTVWYRRELTRALRNALRKGITRAGKIVQWFIRLDYSRVSRNLRDFLVSQQFRAALARGYVTRRIDHWEQRGQLNQGEAALLRDHLDHEESGSYLTDFGVHITTKPLVKVTTYVFVPFLVGAGVLAVGWIPFAIVFCGATARTLYTGGRLIQSLLLGQERPWIAFVAGLLPMIGNLAYPLQLAYASTSQDHQLAQFILYDSFSQTGQQLPIWGGCDTLTEHHMNRLPKVLMRLRRNPVNIEAEPSCTDGDRP